MGKFFMAFSQYLNFSSISSAKLISSTSSTTASLQAQLSSFCSALREYREGRNKSSSGGNYGRIGLCSFYRPPGSPGVTLLSASSVRTLGFIEMNHSRPPDLMSSSYVSLPFAWITGPRKRTQLVQEV